MRHLFALVALTGCDRWQTCEERAEWTLAFKKEGLNSPGDGMFALRPDGELLVAVTPQSDSVQLGDRQLATPHLARISRDGRLLDAVPAPEITDLVTQLQLDAAGNVTLATGSEGRPRTILSYGADLTHRWSYPLGATLVTLDVDADGHVALGADIMGMPTVSLLEPTGELRWTTPSGPHQSKHVRFGDDGTLHRYVQDFEGHGVRARFSLTDGAPLEATELPALPHIVDRDGSFYAFVSRVHPEPASLEAFDATGRLKWQHTFDALEVTIENVRGPNGSVLAHVSRETAEPGWYDFALVRLDRASGSAHETRMCNEASVVAADSSAYVAIGGEVMPSGIDLFGIGRFPFD